MKGIGLLYPYFGKLTIVVSGEDNSLLKVANVLANPKSNSQNGDISVQYPVRILSNELPRGNIVYVGYSKEECTVCYFGEFIIKTTKNCFCYKGINYYGDYLVMQIKEKKEGDGYILSVESNNSNILKKIIFLRRMILPGDINGENPYLNNLALIYLNNEYYIIKEYGLDMVNINKNYKHSGDLSRTF